MANIKADEISKILREQIANYEQTVSVDEVGAIISVGDGIARIHGLEKVMAGEMLAFPHNVFGLALNLEEEEVGAVLLGESSELKEGDVVKRTNTIMSVPVGPELIGRAVNPLGLPLDDKGPITSKIRNPLESLAPGVLDRQPVREPLQTGIKAIDSMIPIGRGQRELIIGDRQTGKTAVILDTIINQKGNDMICIYCAIGQKRSTIAQVIKALTDAGAMEYTIIVASSAAEPASLQYIAPYAACAMGEYFRDNKRQVAGSLRLDMAQFRELAAFAQFGADQLDKVTQAQLQRGQRLTEVLKQDQFVPLSVEKQVLVLYVATSGGLDNVAVADVRRFEKEFVQFAETNYPGVLKDIATKKALDDGIKATIKTALDGFKERFTAALAATAK